jgi:hypothetical protein
VRQCWPVIALVMVACGAGSVANPTPILVSITQGVETCGDVIRAVAQHLYCDEGKAACYTVATYNVENPTENVVAGNTNSDTAHFAGLGRIRGLSLGITYLDQRANGYALSAVHG